MLTLKSEKLDYGYKLIQSFNEITPELLEFYVKNVKVPKYFSIVAICRKYRMFDFGMLQKGAQRQAIGVKCFIVHTNPEELNIETAKCGDIAIITRSSLDLATNLVTACPFNEDVIAAYLKDGDLYQKVSLGNLAGEDGTDNIILVGYKIVPNTAIAAIIPGDAKQEKDPYKI